MTAQLDAHVSLVAAAPVVVEDPGHLAQDALQRGGAGLGAIRYPNDGLEPMAEIVDQPFGELAGNRALADTARPFQGDDPVGRCEGCIYLSLDLRLIEVDPVGGSRQVVEHRDLGKPVTQFAPVVSPRLLRRLAKPGHDDHLVRQFGGLQRYVGFIVRHGWAEKTVAAAVDPYRFELRQYPGVGDPVERPRAAQPEAAGGHAAEIRQRGPHQLTGSLQQTKRDGKAGRATGQQLGPGLTRDQTQEADE